jgi:bla regulator protein blaR1
MTTVDASSLVQHLWQSTLFAGGAWLLTIFLRYNRAVVRYRLWMVCSIKFLIPLSILVGLGSHAGLPRFARTAALAIPPQFPLQVGRADALAVRRDARFGRPAEPKWTDQTSKILFGIWLCGFLIGAGLWFSQWQGVRAILRGGRRIRMPGVRIPVVAVDARLEPGVFGIRHPVLLLPEGILESLTPAQLQGIVAHELCHVERRDNLTAAIHLGIETTFWFYPPLRWIRARLLEERERACDEEVVRLSGEPEVYAEGILSVCKFYLDSPPVWVSGVTGSNLKKRIRDIMNHTTAESLSLGKKVLLWAAGTMVVVGPFLAGGLSAPPIHAQSQTSTPLAFEVASVKANHSSDMRGMNFQFLPGGRLSAKGVPVFLLIAEAYDVAFQSVRLSGGPPWIRSFEDRYDIDAVAPKGSIPAGLTSKAREKQTRLMLQTLLAERFKLKVISETKELPAYVLAVGKNGPKLQKSKLEEKDCAEAPATPNDIPCHAIQGGMGRGMHAKAADLADVAMFVENWADRPVIDQTGLAGLYELDTDGWAPMRPRPARPGGEQTAEDIAMADPTRLTLFQVFDKLGLKLEARKAPVETFVIDRVEKPTEN